MEHSRKDYNRIQDPEHKIPEDEPVFLLRAQDSVAADVVRYYAAKAEATGASPEFVQKARDHATKMDAWPVKKVPDHPTQPFADAAPVGDGTSGFNSELSKAAVDENPA